MHSWGRPRARLPTDCAASEQLRSWSHVWLFGLAAPFVASPTSSPVRFRNLDRLTLVFNYGWIAAEMPADLAARLAARCVRLAVMRDLQVEVIGFRVPHTPTATPPLHFSSHYSSLPPPPALFPNRVTLLACLLAS